MIGAFVWSLLALAVAAVALRVIYRLPRTEGEASRAIPPSRETRLGDRALRLAEQHDGDTGVVDLADGSEAFAARMVLAQAAEASIDYQVYSWHGDTTGWILLEELRKAAARGVRVRLLLDDGGTAGMDGVMAAMNRLPGVEVRLFSPFTLRWSRTLAYLLDFRRLNRRMHNKSMTVDGAVSIVGGRNVGDSYFAYGPDIHYFDFDILAMGRVAGDIARDFDRYWACAVSFPAEAILPDAPSGIETLKSESERANATPKGVDYAGFVGKSDLIERILGDEAALDQTEVTLISDDPAKGRAEAGKQGLLLTQLLNLLERPARSLDVVSAYFIPGRFGTDLLTRLSGDGVRVRVLTNSLDSTDVPLVHGAYAKYRRRLLEAGVALRELCSSDGAMSGDSRKKFGSGSAGLHAKTFAIDGQRVFTGSFNLDPRSAWLNTEMGLLIESPMIAGDLIRKLDESTMSYDVSIGASGRLEWVARDGEGETTRFRSEPNAGLKRRLISFAARVLPGEWML